ncbi:MAG: DUF4337 domain-containing protein [Armatimonadetes bacterium]|nr:DUF4337 domain-containing protein [Armatimonadota bacterium]
MEPQEILESANVTEDKRSGRIDTVVAVTIALVATFMGLCKVKDDNIVQAMQQAQADRIDNWGWYQAHKTRLEVAEGVVAEFQVMPASPARDAGLAKWQGTVEKQKAEQDETKKKAEDAEKAYNDWNVHDDQFDLADGAIAVAIALLAVTALTKKWWLFFLALAPTTFGVIMGLAGFLGWSIHPDALAKFLGT